MPYPSVRENEIFVFEDREVYNVTAICRAIAENPNRFRRGITAFEQLFAQLDGTHPIDTAYAVSLPLKRIDEPLILIEYPNGSCRLIDGHHRAYRRRMRGDTIVPVIIVPADLVPEFTLPAELRDFIR